MNIVLIDNQGRLVATVEFSVANCNVFCDFCGECLNCYNDASCYRGDGLHTPVMKLEDYETEILSTIEESL